MASVAIIGPGAIGCALGAAIIERDRDDLVLCGRTGFQRIEVSVEHAAPNYFPARCETDPSRVAVADIVLLCTKAHQTASAGDWFEATIGPETLVVVLQNGVDHRARVQPLIGPASLLEVVVDLPASHLGPGRIGRGNRADLTAPVGPSGDRLVEIFADTFVRVQLVDDWLTRAWMKLLLNAATGAITALAQRSNAIFADPEATRLSTALMEEVAAVGRAEGAVLPADVAEQIAAGLSARVNDGVCSIAADRMAGRPTEWRTRNAVVVDLAAKHGIEVPLNQAMTALIRLGEPR